MVSASKPALEDLEASATRSATHLLGHHTALTTFALTVALTFALTLYDPVGATPLQPRPQLDWLLAAQVYKMEDSSMQLKGTYPKAVNAQDARIKFRKRKPKLGGADETLLGVGGMGDDIWRELVERDNWSDVDDAWAAFRKELELGREIEVVDENGERIQNGDFPDDEDPEYD